MSSAAAPELGSRWALVAAYDESKHARWPQGTPVDPSGAGGGRFAPKQRGGYRPLQATPTNRARTARTIERWQAKLNDPDPAVAANAAAAVTYWQQKLARIDAILGTQPDPYDRLAEALDRTPPPPGVPADINPDTYEAARRAFAYLKKNGEFAADYEGGNQLLSAIYQGQGFHAPPTIVSPAEFDRLMTENAGGGSPLVYGERGVLEHVESFPYGRGHFAGRGVFGSGTYIASIGTGLVDETANTARDQAVMYAATLDHAPDAGIIRMLIPRADPEYDHARVVQDEINLFRSGMSALRSGTRFPEITDRRERFLAGVDENVLFGQTIMDADPAVEAARADRMRRQVLAVYDAYEATNMNAGLMEEIGDDIGAFAAITGRRGYTSYAALYEPTSLPEELQAETHYILLDRSAAITDGRRLVRESAAADTPDWYWEEGPIPRWRQEGDGNYEQRSQLPDGEERVYYRTPKIERPAPASWAATTAAILVPVGPYDGIDFTVPKGVRRAAKRALDLMKRTRTAGIHPAGRQRAIALANGRTVGPEDVRKIRNYLDGRASNDPRTPHERRDDTEWLAWGGDCGLEWSRRLCAALDSADMNARFAAFDESKHTRWPQGTPVSGPVGGGRFAPHTTSPASGTSTRRSTAADWENHPARAEILATIDQLTEQFQTPISRVEFGWEALERDLPKVAARYRTNDKSPWACAHGTSRTVYILGHPDDHTEDRRSHAGQGWTGTATHEFGHILEASTVSAIDGERREDLAAARRAAAVAWHAQIEKDRKAGKPIGIDYMPTSLAVHGITRYGLSNDREFYAETFTAWQQAGGRPASGFLRRVAKSQGWETLNPDPMRIEVRDPKSGTRAKPHQIEARYGDLLGINFKQEYATYRTWQYVRAAADTPDLIDEPEPEPVVPGVYVDGPDGPDFIPDDAVTAAFDESKHGRWPKGTKIDGPAGGGRFAPTDSKQDYARLSPEDRPNRPRGFFAPSAVFTAIQQQAADKARNVPQPSAEKIKQNRMVLDRAKNTPGARAGGELRGNAAARRARAERLFAEFGGTERGYVPCVYCGIKTSPKGRDGHASMEQDKILTAAEGGGYRIENLLPACRGCNAHRNDDPYHVRPDWARAAAGIAGSEEWEARPLGWDDDEADVRDGTVRGELIRRQIDTPETGSYEQWIIDGEVVDPDTARKTGTVTAAFDETKHARWPAGTPVNAEGHGGGRFAPQAQPVVRRHLQVSPEKHAEAQAKADRWKQRLADYQAAGEPPDVIAKAEREAAYWQGKADRILAQLDQPGTAEDLPPEPSPAPEPPAPEPPAPTPAPEPPAPPAPGQQTVAPGTVTYAEWSAAEPDVPVGWEGDLTNLSGATLTVGRYRKVGERTPDNSGWEIWHPYWPNKDGTKGAWKPVTPGGAWGGTGDWLRPPVTGGVDPGWRTDRQTLAAIDGAPLSFETLLPPGDAKAFLKVIKTDKLTIGPPAAEGKAGDYSEGPPKPEHAIVYKGRIEAMNALGTALGYTPEETAAALAANNAAWDSWATAGGRGTQRDQLEQAMAHLRDGGTARNDLERGLLIQRGYTQAVLRARGETEVGITRFIQNEYAATAILARDAGADTIDAWPLTSWATPAAGKGVMNRFIGKDGYAVQLTGTAPADAVWLTYHGEPYFRTSQLKAPGEIVIDDRDELRFSNLQVDEWIGDDRIYRHANERAKQALPAAPDPEWISPALAISAWQNPAPATFHLLGATPPEQWNPDQDPYHFSKFLPEGWTASGSLSPRLTGPDGVERDRWDTEGKQVLDAAHAAAAAQHAADRRATLQAAKDLGYQPSAVTTILERQNVTLDAIRNVAMEQEGRWGFTPEKGPYRYTASDWDRADFDNLNQMRESVGLPPLNPIEIRDLYELEPTSWQNSVIFATEAEARAAWEAAAAAKK